MSQADTKTRLLDAAESLFSGQGFACTSMRAITTKADANLAAANYHFGSKEALLNAVLERRLLPLNQLRSDNIDLVLAEASKSALRPKTEDLLRAFIKPTMDFRCGQNGSRDFVAMIGRLMTAADPAVRENFVQLVQPLFNKLHNALCIALPHLHPELISTRLFFTLGAMGHCLCFAEISQLFDLGSCEKLDETEALTNNLITFVTAGLETSC